jgi:hypothetical protein
MRTVGRLLRTLRIAAGLSVDDAAVAGEVSALRLRELEAGIAELGYLEGLLLAKAYLMCPTCFSKHFRGAVARGEAADRSEEASDVA